MSRKEWDLMTRKKLTLAYAKHYQRASSKGEVYEHINAWGLPIYQCLTLTLPRPESRCRGAKMA